MLIEIIHTAFEDEPTKVAEFDAPDDKTTLAALEWGYRNTNTVDALWTTGAPALGIRLAPHVVARGGARSTSMGDLARVTHADGAVETWRCARMGWQKSG